jgi:hypothetical protein
MTRIVPPRDLVAGIFAAGLVDTSAFRCQLSPMAPKTARTRVCLISLDEIGFVLPKTMLEGDELVNFLTFKVVTQRRHRAGAAIVASSALASATVGDVLHSVSRDHMVRPC